jgi:hypothetical protein
LKANQSDLEALEAVVAAKANQVLVSSLQVQLGSLSAEVEGKQSQLRAGYEEGSHPLLVGTYDDDLVFQDTIRALRVSAPIVATQSRYVVDLSLDESLATQEELDATNAQLLATKNNVNILFASNEALSGEVDALAAEVAGKQGQLTPGTVADGFPVLGNGYVRALQALAPLKIAPDTQFLQIRLDQAELAATPAIAALQTAVGTKQSQLFAGEVEGGHRLLLQSNLFVGGGFDEGTSPSEPLPGDTVRALKVSSPLVATSDNSHVHVSLDPGWAGGNPVFCGGRVDGTTSSAVSSIGRVGYTVSRPSGQAQGIWTITFDSPAATNDYTVQLVNMNFGNSYLWDQMPPTVQGFTVVVVNNLWSLRNAPFHFTVLG